MELHLLPRLFVDAPLTEGSTLQPSTQQTHYLTRVMRLSKGSSIRFFNGRDGEWLGQIATIGKKFTDIKITRQTRAHKTELDLWLYCAPIKKAHFEYMIEKATELGVAGIQPILTDRTQIRDVNTDRCRAIAIEAAEQSERLNIPAIPAAIPLKSWLANPPTDSQIIICAESGNATPYIKTLNSLKKHDKTLVLTGPEGGFSPDEFAALRNIQCAHFVRLGPRILRADTAALSALSGWQAVCGDWQP